MRQPATGAMACCSLLLLVAAPTACSNSGSGIPVPPAGSAGMQTAVAGFEARLQPESWIDGGSAEQLILEPAPGPHGVELTLRVTGARGLKAAYAKVSYDPLLLVPERAEPGGLLGGPEATLSLAHLNEPGAVYFGQVLRQWESSPGASGDGVLARIRFAARQQPAARQGSTAPNTPRDKVQLRWDYTTDSLLWYYRNTGDYDQNGMVGLSDLTPLGQHFGKSSPGGFAEDSAICQADGDGNGAIQLGDLALLGINWGKSCLGGYYVYRSTNKYDCPADPDEPPDPDTYEGMLAFGDAKMSTNGRKRFSFTFDPAYEGHYYWVRPNDKLQDGSASDPLEYQPLSPGDWSTFGHDAQHTFCSSYAGPVAQPQLLWECDLGSAVRSNPVATNSGVIYATTDDAKLHAVSPQGELLWSVPLDSKGNLSSTPAIGPDGTVYVGSRYYLCAVFPNSSWRWYKEVPNCYYVSPVVTQDNQILITGKDINNELYCFDPNGELQWGFTTSVNNGSTTPALAGDGTIYASFNGLRQFGQDEYVYRFTPQGEEAWHAVFTDQVSALLNAGAPSISAAGSVHVVCKDLIGVGGDFSPRLQTLVSGENSPAAVKLTGWPDGELSISGAAIAASGVIYARVGYSVGLESELFAIAPNLTVQWQQRLVHDAAQVQTVYTPTLDASGRIYIVENSTLLAYLPDGTTAWSLDAGAVLKNSVSILGPGLVVAGCDDGFLRAYSDQQ